ncbi:MurR/RpiR family transcriptional regulator [Photobacterium makurazakiensis]|uniref:MurR/RpiR family transcriptional regulator n=1 Tax=Photobacterium makurazakiensis TaxID=2910234 RepID=UPI003D0E5B3A
MENKIDVISLIFEKHDAFSETEKKIAQFITDDSRLVAVSSISKLSTMIGVSAASISRFARALGFENIRELKFHLAQSLGLGETPDIDNRLATSGYNLIYESISTVLLNNVTTLSGSHITLLADFIEEAGTIYILGSDSITYSAAEDAQYRFTTQGKIALTSHDPSLIDAYSHNFRANDVVLCLSINQHHELLSQSAAKAKEQGCRVIAITSQLSQLSHTADLVLPINTHEIASDFRLSACRHLLMAYFDAVELEMVMRKKK